MSYVNLTPCERETLLRGILESDTRYLEKLVEKRYKLMLEFQLLESSIQKKVAEIQVMQAQLDFVEQYN